MKKLFYSNFWSRMLVLLALVSVSVAAKADDLGELQLDTDYQLISSKSYEGYFVAPSSGKLTYRNMLTPYSDAAHTNEINGEWEGYSNGYGECSIQVTEGQTVYFYNFWVMDNCAFRLSMDKPFSMDFCSLDEGTTLSCTGRGAIEIRMSEKPTYTGVKFICEGKEFDWNGITTVRQEKYLVIEFASSLVAIMEANPEVVGKNCQVVFEGLASDNDASKLYNGNGVLTLNFVVGKMPTKIVSENVSAATIDSWFRPSEEKGFFTITFNKNIKSGSIIMGYGANVESDNYYTETPEMTINGSTITVDLRGTQRRLELQTDDSGNPCKFYFKLQSFIDENDEYIFSTDQGSLGSVSFNLPYNLITTNLTAEFTPDANADLSNVDNIEIYFTPAKNVLFDGVKFTWDGNAAGVTIDKGDLTIDYDSFDGCAVTFAVPAEAKNACNVNVSIVGLDTPDGLDYSEYMKAIYNTGEAKDFSLTLVSPKDGSTLEGLVSGESKIKIYAENLPNDADELEIMCRIYDPAAEDPIYTAFLWSAAPEEDETEVYNYAQTVYEDLDFFKGVDYRLNITVDKITYPAAGGRDVQNIANYNYTIHGAAEKFLYSEVALSGIDPNPVTTDIISVDQNIITLKFDGAVTVTKAGTPIGFGGGLSAWTVKKADTDGCVWTVEIPASVIENSKSGFSVSVWAVDASNNPVCKTTVDGINPATQNKANTYFSFDYICTLGAPDFVVNPASETQLEVLDKIYVSYSEGIDPNWNNTLPVSLYKGKGTNQELIEEWKPEYFDMWNDDVCVEYGDINLKWCIMLAEPITEPGYYTLVFPNAFFNLGSEFNQASSRLTNVHYIIPETEIEADKITCEPASGSTVTSLKTIKITWDDATDAGIDWNVTDAIVLYDENKQVVCNAGIDMSEDFNDPWNMLVVTLDNEVTTDGTYVLHIPAGKVLLNDGNQSSTEQNITFVVKTETTGIVDIQAIEGNCSVYNLQGIRVNATDLASGIYIINGKKVKIVK